MRGKNLFPALILLIGFGESLIFGQKINLPETLPIYRYGLVDAFPGVKFTQPVAVVTAPGEESSLFIVERDGRIVIIPDLRNPEPKGFLDLRSKTHARHGESGLLGLVFHPDYQQNGRFFVFRTGFLAGKFADILSEFRRDPQDRTVARADSEVVLIAQEDGSDIHNSGDLHFGPDGYLYISLGYDGPIARKELQSIDEGLFGGIIRIDVDFRPGSLSPNSHPAATSNYRIPQDNPFIGATQFNGKVVDPAQVRTELWAIGMRNPWRFTFDPNTAKLICGDVGDGWFEEVNIVEKGGNYGWPFIEGKGLVHKPGAPANRLPLYEYIHGSGSFEGRAIIGGVVYTGTALPELTDKYLFADIVSGNLWALNPNEPNPRPIWVAAQGGISAFGKDPRTGEVLVANLYRGEIQKLIYRPPEQSGIPTLLSQVNAFTNLATLSGARVMEYQVNTPFWSDGAIKRRWVSLENADQPFLFKASEPWGYPPGSIFIKHFDFEMTNGVPSSRRRLETRFFVKSTNGSYGLTYRWNAAGTDAELVPPEGIVENLIINDGGKLRQQKWYFPGWEQCNLCHTEKGGTILGFNTYQLNKSVQAAETTINQLELMRLRGFFSNPGEVQSDLHPRFSSLADTNAPLQHKVRSYLSSNCVQCHQPGGSSAMRWDARITTPIETANIINAPSSWYHHPLVRLIVPKSVDYSFMYHRLYHDNEWFRMPPIASVRADQNFIGVLTNWIFSIPTGGWSTHNIGSALLEGSAEQGQGNFKLFGTGRGITEDSILYFAKQFPVLSEISGRLSNLNSLKGEAGVMIRGSENGDSSYAAFYVSANELLFRVRSNTEEPSEIVSTIPSRAVAWIGLERNGNQVSARYMDTNGRWIQIGTRSVQFGDSFTAGFFVASPNAPASFTAAHFSEYRVRGMDISLVDPQGEGRSVLLKAFHEDGTPGSLTLESSSDLLQWQEESDTTSERPGELTAVQSLDLQEKFYRLIKTPEQSVVD